MLAGDRLGVMNTVVKVGNIRDVGLSYDDW